MDTNSPSHFQECCRAIVGDMAKALSERNGEPPEQQVVRTWAAVQMIMGMLPRDVAEMLLASHCVMLHELMVVSAHEALCATEARQRHAALHDLGALNKAFCGNVDRLKSYQKRPAEGTHEASEGARSPPSRAETASAAVAQPAARAVTTQAAAQAASDAAATAQVSAQYDVSAMHHPTAGQFPLNGVNPAAAAALNAGDVAGFARALGIEPGAAFLAAAAAEGSPFDPASSGPWPESEWSNKPKS